MRRACRPSPAWLRWALPACAVLLLAPRPATGQCAGPAFGPFAGPTVSGEPWGVVVGDFWGATGDPDGRLDVVVAKKSANMVTLLRGDGLGSFLAPIDIPVGIGPTDLVAADFNRDGRLDLAVVVDAQILAPVNRVELLAGTGIGFGTPVPPDVGALPSRLAKPSAYISAARFDSPPPRRSPAGASCGYPAGRCASRESASPSRGDRAYSRYRSRWAT